MIALATILILNNTNVLKASASPVYFPFGVESGDVTSTSAVLWEKADRAASLEVQVSTSPSFDTFVSKKVPAMAEKDYTLKTKVDGLKDNTVYYYRWTDGTTFSEVGQFKTVPLKSQELRFSWSGDTDPSKYPVNRYFGTWDVLKAALNEKPDFFIYLGDVIYSDYRANTGKTDKKGGLVSDSFHVPQAESLKDFWGIYQDQKDSMRNMNLQSIPIYALWDDHEVKNDWAGQVVKTIPADKSRYDKAKEAFDEYMPINSEGTATDSDCVGPTQYRTIHWGSIADIIILDTRSCRSENAQNACGGAVPDLAPTLPEVQRKSKDVKMLLSPKVKPECLNEIEKTARTMLGAKQKASFESDLFNSKAKFKFVITSVNMQQSYALPYDSWEGYQAERNEILNYIDTNNIKNVIFLSTDSHLSLINEVSIDHFTKPKPIAQEFVVGPIAALTDGDNLRAKTLSMGPDFYKAKQSILTLAGAECRNLDVPSYGIVSYDAPTNSIQITLKDKAGNVIKDQHTTGVTCTKTIPAS